MRSLHKDYRKARRLQTEMVKVIFHTLDHSVLKNKFVFPRMDYYIDNDISFAVIPVINEWLRTSIGNYIAMYLTQPSDLFRHIIHIDTWKLSNRIVEQEKQQNCGESFKPCLYSVFQAMCGGDQHTN